MNERTAVALLILAEGIIARRRFYEKICGYPDEYGDDKNLLSAIRFFLNSDEVRPIVEKIKQETGQ